MWSMSEYLVKEREGEGEEESNIYVSFNF